MKLLKGFGLEYVDGLKDLKVRGAVILIDSVSLSAGYPHACNIRKAPNRLFDK